MDCVPMAEQMSWPDAIATCVAVACATIAFVAFLYFNSTR